jgi:hypothetical protein
VRDIGCTAELGDIGGSMAELRSASVDVGTLECSPMAFPAKKAPRTSAATIIAMRNTRRRRRDTDEMGSPDRATPVGAAMLTRGLLFGALGVPLVLLVWRCDLVWTCNAVMDPS